MLITIPKKLIGRDDLVVIPRKEYKALLKSQRVGVFSPTVAQRKALLRAEKNFRAGKSFSYDALFKKFGVSR